jgi:hypothetical protein
MGAPRISFEEYLKQEGKVEGKSENTSRFGDLRATAAINYLFSSEADARNFAKKFEIRAHNSREVFLGEQVIFKDPIDKKWAVLVNPYKHAELVEKYGEHLKNSGVPPRSRAEIQAQITAIRERQRELEKTSKDGSPLANHLDNLHSLASNREKGGWYSGKATSAFQMSLQNFIALNLDRLNAKEAGTLKTVSEYMSSEDNGVRGRIKADSSWWEYTRFTVRPPLSESQLETAVVTDTLYLLDGVKNRRVISEETPSKAGHQSMVVSDSEWGVAKRDIPRFFPDDAGHSETDELVLDSGGMSTHRTVTKIWKRGVRIDGSAVKSGEAPHHYQYYQTEYNAGAGLGWAEAPRYNPETKGNTTGVAWTVSTRPITPTFRFHTELKAGASVELEGSKMTAPDPAKNLKEYNRAMHDTIADIIISQRMVTRWKPAQPSDVAGDPQSYSESGSDAAKRWTHWHNRLESHLGKRNDSLSKKGVPQTSGNCTVMSLKVFVDDHAANLSEEHWRYAKEHNANSTRLAFTQKLAELEVELKQSNYFYATEVSGAKDAKTTPPVAMFGSDTTSREERFFNALREPREKEAKQLLSQHPELLNAVDSEFKSTPLITIVAKAKAAAEAKKEGLCERYLSLAYHLLEQKGCDVNVQDRTGNTALHRAAYYATDPRGSAGLKRLFTDLVIKLVVEKKARRNLYNSFDETQDDHIERDGVLCARIDAAVKAAADEPKQPQSPTVSSSAGFVLPMPSIAASASLATPAAGQQVSGPAAPSVSKKHEENNDDKKVQEFLKIYTALREGQTSLFKTRGLLDKKDSLTLNDIQTYIRSHPDSRTSVAYKLMNKYFGKPDQYWNLASEIYQYSYSKSSMFSKSRYSNRLFDCKKADEIKVNDVSDNTRTTKILRSLGPKQG